jgi:cytochrome b
VSQAEKIQFWDPLVRVIHLSFALVFVANYFLNEGGEAWHEYLGYYACSCLLGRLVWGFVSSRSAAWRYFWPSFRSIQEHLGATLRGQVYNRLGHTPLGSIVMLLMMLSILGLGVTGFMMEEIDAFWGEDWVQDLHHGLANILCGLVCLHILGGIYQSIKLKENLLFAMITGKRKSSPN